MPIVINGPDSLRFQTDSKRLYPLGTELHLQDGRKFRFGRNGNATAARGSVYQSEVPDANFDTRTSGCVVMGTDSRMWTRTGNPCEARPIVETRIEEGRALVATAA